MKNIHYGAGNIGRGFIGYLSAKSGNEVVFVDVNTKLIDVLKKEKKYNVIQLNDSQLTETVEGVEAIDSQVENEKLIAQLQTAELITTAMGVNNLKFIIPDLVKMAQQNLKDNKEQKVNVICCENGIRVSSSFKEQLYDKIDNELKSYFDKYVSFVDAAVDRIIPNQKNKNILDVQVEPNFEWVIDETQLIMPLEIDGLKKTNNLDYFNQRKLLTVNAGHAAVAYLGYERGYKYIAEALDDEEILQTLKLFLFEMGHSLSYKFNFDSKEHNEYIEKTINRFKNKLIIDEITRVGRNPLTKLGHEERLIKPLLILCEKDDDNYLYIMKVINAALNYDVDFDEEAKQLSKLILECGKRQAFTKISQICDERVLRLIEQN